jgi:acetyltransferase-like isoleucine patch superfamily enzyme
MREFYRRVLFLLSVPLLFCIFVLIVMFKLRLVSYLTAAIIVSCVPGEIGDHCRNVFYRKTLKKVGIRFRIGFLSYICYPSVVIGDRVTIENHCIISQCTIGNDVIIASRVSTMSGKNHHFVDDLTKTFYQSGGKVKSINLGDNLWIGTHAIIMEDVAPGTVVGAGSVVTREFPANAIIAGVPARLIRMRGVKTDNG